MTSGLFTLDEMKPLSVERLVLVVGDDLVVELDEEPPRGGALADGHHNLLQVEPRLRWSLLAWLGDICWFILHILYWTD